jgi:hypothetical protein
LPSTDKRPMFILTRNVELPSHGDELRENSVGDIVIRELWSRVVATEYSTPAACPVVFISADKRAEASAIANMAMSPEFDCEIPLNTPYR